MPIGTHFQDMASQYACSDHFLTHTACSMSKLDCVDQNFCSIAWLTRTFSMSSKTFLKKTWLTALARFLGGRAGGRGGWEGGLASSAWHIDQMGQPPRLGCLGMCTEQCAVVDVNSKCWRNMFA